jgi:2-polyprenyl-6-methoxyphenol hydroxylase-like FAD-dependent oxidoreductase
MGQGGGQAVEDAVVLAEVLSQAASLEQGLREYERRRYPRTKQFVDNSRRATALSHGMSPMLRFARRWVVPYVPEWLREREAHKVFRFEI